MNSLSDCRNALRSLGSKFSYCVCLLVLLRSARVAADCGNVKVLERGGISCSLIKDIVSAHNELRDSVAKGLVKNQPAASDMREIYWDEELANGAQDWADQCTFAHNSQKDREVARFRVGQNLALTKNKGTTNKDQKEFRTQTINWFNEHKDFKFGPIPLANNGPAVGHYTQLIWADTYLVGCGYSRYKTSSNVTHRLYVCHYGPEGNIVEEEPYKRGPQKCPEDLIRSKKYPGLCRLRESIADTCKMESKKTNKHVGKNPRRSEVSAEQSAISEGISGRRFLTPISASSDEMNTSQEREQSTGVDSNVTPDSGKVIFNMFFSFYNHRRQHLT